MKKIIIYVLIFSVLTWSFPLTGSACVILDTDEGIHITSPADNSKITTTSFSISGVFDNTEPKGYIVYVNVKVNSKEKNYRYILQSASKIWGPITISIDDFGLSLSNGAKFDVSVKALLEDNIGIPVMNVSTRTYTFKWVSATPPLIPTLLSPSDGYVFTSLENIKLHWKSVASADGYNIQVSDDVNFKNQVLNRKITTTLCLVSKDLLNYGKTYYWRVNAFNSFGTLRWSTVNSFSVVDSNPPIITVISPEDNYVTSDPHILVNGSVSDNESGVKELKINNREISFSGGSFSATVDLAEGLNKINIVAIDKTGNKSSKTLNVIYSKQKSETEIVINLQINNPLMLVNGVQQEIDPGRGTKPVIIPKWGRTVVPIRAIVEALGGTIGWDGTERKVTINFNETTIELWIGKPKASVNGEMKWIDENNHDVKPIIVNGRTMLPLRFVVENLGCSVKWYPETSAITITYTP